MNEPQLILALDPGIKRSAALLIDCKMHIHAITQWETCSASQPFRAAAQAALEIWNVVNSMDYNNDEVVLVHEDVYFPRSGPMAGNPKPIIDLCKSIGIWIARFPFHVIPVTSGAWRKNCGINQKDGREVCKEQSIALMKGAINNHELVIGGRVFEIKDHISDAYWIGKAYVDGVVK